MQASKNFSYEELQCRGCHRKYCRHENPICNISTEAIEKLQKLRDLCGVPLTVTSAARCPEHNSAEGGAEKSKHISSPSHESTAFDVVVPPGFCTDTLAKLAEKAGFKSIGTYPTFVHMDDRKSKARWDMR